MVKGNFVMCWKMNLSDGKGGRGGGRGDGRGERYGRNQAWWRRTL